MSDSETGFEKRLDALMSVLVTLDECEVITDPSIATTQLENGIEVTVEFLLDYDRERGDG